MSWVTVLRGGKHLRCAVARTREGVWVGWAGRAAYFAAGHKSSPAAAHGAVDGAIQAPMTGKVVAVRVRPGHRVEAGDLLVVLEAMKMEYRLAAPRSGTVGEVHCQEGELVDLGKTLVTLAE